MQAQAVVCMNNSCTNLGQALSALNDTKNYVALGEGEHATLLNSPSTHTAGSKACRV